MTLELVMEKGYGFWGGQIGPSIVIFEFMGNYLSLWHLTNIVPGLSSASSASLLPLTYLLLSLRHCQALFAWQLSAMHRFCSQ